MDLIACAVIAVFLVIDCSTGIAAATKNADIIGMAVAGSVGFVFLCLVIGTLVVSFIWTDWFNNLMMRKGKVKMPRAYFMKKEEARRRLISGSVPSHLESVGHPPVPSVDRDDIFPEAKETNKPETASSNYYTQVANETPIANGNPFVGTNQETKSPDSKAWVHGWRQEFPNKIYEEKGVSLELGEEGDEEFKIETELAENETLDVGPYKRDHSKEIAMKGDVYSDPYIYSTVDTARKSHANSVKPGAPNTTTIVKPSKGPKEMDADYSTPNDVKITSFNDALVHL